MATTTNFGWTTPDDTALVKDGAAAIRSLGSSIDTSLGGAWTSYTPTVTNLTLGNGTVNFRYKQINKTVFVTGKLTFGSTTTGVTNPITFTLPVTANSNDTQRSHLGYISDSNGSDWSANIYIGTTTQIYVYALDAAASYVRWAGLSATVPMTWATNDFISFSFTYEAA